MEFINGFSDFGYEISYITNIDDCKDKDILLLSNHIINIDYLNKLNTINSNAVYILWYYHSVINQIPFKKWILTGEYFHKTPRLQSHINLDNINKSINNFVPLMLRADEAPEKIGTYERKNEINGCFMGSPYKSDWVAGLANIMYHDIINGLINYNERRHNHLRSKVAFGFSNDANILNYHPTQRIFEGLSYGCVVISDNEAARDMTDGIVEFVNNKEEFLQKYNYFLEHPEECRKKELEGYEWAKKYGTNRYSASLFLNKMKELKFI
jgi:spore maturation protein CgeB